MRPLITQVISLIIRREFLIRESLELTLGWQPQVRVRGVYLANTLWGQNGTLAEAEEVIARIDLLALLQGRFVFPELILQRPVLHLERIPGNLPNWILLDEQPLPPLEVERLTIRAGRITLNDSISAIKFAGQFHETPDLSARALSLQGQGTIRNYPTTLELRAGSFSAFLVPGRVFNWEGCFNWGATHARSAGILRTPRSLQDWDLEFEMSGENPADLTLITGIKLLDLPAYQVRGHLSQQGKKWITRNLYGVLGGSDFIGEITWEDATPRPLLTGQLHSNQLALIDLGIGQPITNTSPEPWEIDIDLAFQGRRVLTPVVLEELTTRMRARAGRIRFEPIDFALAGGRVRASLELNTHFNPMPMVSEAHFQRLDLNQLLLPLNLNQKNLGNLTGRLILSGAGGSLPEVLTTGEGEAVLAVTRGQMNSLLLTLARLDIANTIVSLLFLGESVDLRCAVTQIRAAQGTLTIAPLVVDTTSTKVTGSGTIDLVRQHLELNLEPHPKDLSLFSAYTPLLVSGKLHDPQVRPKVGALGGRMAAAAALAAIMGPLGAVLPFIEPGIREDSDCQDLVRSSTLILEDR